ncbi:MAG: EAL domain-containing protein [Burkholderiaceae bacterium]|nr:EAL domain-containing protein [Burkholderiaceae bacterium]
MSTPPVPPRANAAPSPEGWGDLGEVVQAVLRHTRFQLRQLQPAWLEACVAGHGAELGCTDLAEYTAVLQRSRSDAERLLARALQLPAANQESGPLELRAPTRALLDALARQRSDAEPLDVWLLMPEALVMVEHLRQHLATRAPGAPALRLHGPAELIAQAQARRGSAPADLRETLRWLERQLPQDGSGASADLILAGELFTCWRPDLQRLWLGRLAAALRSGGLLLLGRPKALWRAPRGLRALHVDGWHWLQRSRPAGTPPRSQAPAHDLPDPPGLPATPAASAAGGPAVAAAATQPADRPDTDPAPRSDASGQAAALPAWLARWSDAEQAQLGRALGGELGARWQLTLQPAQGPALHLQGQPLDEPDGVGTHADDALQVQTRLAGAQARQELELLYQPQLDVATGRLRAVEALLRWNHPTLGLVEPGAFIPWAEQCGLIVELGRWVLQRACRQLRHWRDLGVPEVPVAVNVSAAQLQAADFVGQVEQALDLAGLPAAALELELTESLLREPSERMRQQLGACRRLGVRIALDDFGTGQTHLARLHRLPLDTLKLDPSLIRHLGSDRGAQAVVRSMVGLGHQLGLAVVAEGVEQAPQLAALDAAHCDAYQGHHATPALSAEQLTPHLQRPLAA